MLKVAGNMEFLQSNDSYFWSHGNVTGLGRGRSSLSDDKKRVGPSVAVLSAMEAAFLSERFLWCVHLCRFVCECFRPTFSEFLYVACTGLDILSRSSDFFHV